MALRLPDFADLGFNDPRAVTGTPVYPQDNPAVAGEATLGAGLQKAGAGLEDIAADQQRKKDKLEEAMATANFAGNYIRTTEALKTETDPEKIAQLRASLDGFRDTAAGAISSPYRRQLWSATHSRSVAEGQAMADLRQTHIYRDKYAAGGDEQAIALARQGATATDPMAFDVALNGVRNLYGDMQSAGVLTAEQALQRRKAAEHQLFGGRIQNLITAKQYDAATSLLDRGDFQPLEIEHYRSRIERAKETSGLDAEASSIYQQFGGGPGKGYTQGAGNYSGGMAPEGSRMSVGDMKASALRAGFTGGDADKIAAISMAESGGDPYAANEKGEHSYGITQINADAHGPKALAARGDPDAAMRLAYEVSKGGTDFKPWTMFKNGQYQKYLAAASAAQVGSGGGDAAEPLATQPSGRIDEINNPELAAQINAAPAAGEPIPLDAPQQKAPAFSQLADIDGAIRSVQDRVVSGQISQERADALSARMRARFNTEQSMQANGRAEMVKRMNNGAAMLEDGRDFEFDPSEVRHYLPKDKAEEVLQSLQDARQAGQILSGVRTASAADLEQQRAQLTQALNDPKATDYARRRKQLVDFDKATTTHFTELTKDPAGYVSRFSPIVTAKLAAVDPKNPTTFADYATSALSEQERLGIPAEFRSVLPIGQAAAVANRIASIDPAKENPVSVIKGIAQSYGAGTTSDYWPHAMKDLVHAKLPGTYQVLATMDKPEQVVAAGDLTRAIGLASEKGGMSVLKKSLGEEKMKDIDTELQSQLSDFRLSTGDQSGGQELYGHVLDAAHDLASYYVYRGKDAATAAKNAVQAIINEKYDFDTIGAGKVRVPKGMSGDVDRAARTVQAGVSVDQLGDIPGSPSLTPEQRKEVWLGAIRAGGWANNEDDSGLVLMGRFRNNAYHVVRRADGSRIEVKFDAAPAIAKGSTISPTPEDVSHLFPAGAMQ